MHSVMCVGVCTTYPTIGVLDENFFKTESCFILKVDASVKASRATLRAWKLQYPYVNFTTLQFVDKIHEIHALPGM